MHANKQLLNSENWTVKCYCSPQSGHGVYTTPIDFYLLKKKVRFISVE